MDNICSINGELDSRIELAFNCLKLKNYIKSNGLIHTDQINNVFEALLIPTKKSINQL